MSQQEILPPSWETRQAGDADPNSVNASTGETSWARPDAESALPPPTPRSAAATLRPANADAQKDDRKPDKKRKKAGILRFFFGDDDDDELTISEPQNFQQVAHVGWNPSTSEFEGLPPEWRSLLNASGISAADQKRNPDKLLKVLEFTQRAGALPPPRPPPPTPPGPRPDRPALPPKPAGQNAAASASAPSLPVQPASAALPGGIVSPPPTSTVAIIIITPTSSTFYSP
eukprot:TRINITY_DN5492_c1_g1_i1.p1 TRINITY_DN5492_c1_g1~~TRINITY_DN5492_c1_g1_i1.p1  ORF type:complete len:230 (-),score=49.72 TRINITY_DN5492_c1_g1_i1:100-789(-)